MRESARALFDRVSKSRGYVASYRVDTVEAADKIREWAEQVKEPVVLNVRGPGLVRQIKDLAGESIGPVMVHADIDGGIDLMRQAVDAGCDSLGVVEEIGAEIWQYIRDRGVWLETSDNGSDSQKGDGIRVSLPLVRGAYSGRNYLLEDDWGQIVNRLKGRPISLAGELEIRNSELRRIGSSPVYRVETDSRELSHHLKIT